MNMFIRSIMLFVFLPFFIGGCSQKLTIQSQSIIQKSEINTENITNIDTKIKNDELDIRNNGEIYLKTNGRSILSVLDELAYKKRMNYTILTSIPPNKLLVYKKDEDLKNIDWKYVEGHTFKTLDGVLKALQSFMNRNCLNCYQIENTSDGIEIVGPDDNYENSYKKVFLFNTTVEEAQKYIDDFFKNSDKKYSIVSMPSQNALLIRGNKEILRQISDVINSLDSSYIQVMIESQVFEYDDTISRKIGTALEYGKTNGNYNYGIKTEFGEGITSLLPTYFGNLTDAAKKQSLLFNLAAQDKKGSVKIVAEPRVVMRPGQEGSIKLNTVKYVIASGVNIAELKEMKTGVVFKIIPTILSEEKIQLRIFLEQSEFIPNQEKDIVQVINQNIIETTLVVNDGELISIGGIYLSKENDFNSGIPLLKDIPIAGYLFGSDSNEKSRVMIEFIIKPTIKNLTEAINDRTQKAINIQNDENLMIQK